MSTARLAVLRTAIRTQPGEWTTHRVLRLYAKHGLRVPFRGTARRDLAQATREGLLTLDDTDPDRRVFRATRHLTCP
ncbi:hypothetical protein [Streptomyces sp. DH12]|uniref:hypothetical protein n=1 Tax=Streptomyces sp. DH12 TaxID=2857010 RepID=UPI001E429098|nr:hypothetical protein [Streptomyces sp. DH12]